RQDEALPRRELELEGVRPMRSSRSRGSSTVELAILMPVYMILTVGLITVGQLVLARQQVAMAVRYQAWLPGSDTPFKEKGDAAIGRSFFSSNAFEAYGKYQKLSTRLTPVPFAAADL